MSIYWKVLRPFRQSWKKRNDDDDRSVDEIIPKLIQAQRWQELRSFLTSSRRRHQVESFFREPCDEPMLMFACRFHPPLDLIEIMFALQREVVLQFADRLGRGPLHYACWHGASPKVISFLLSKQPSMAAKQDVSGKTPLHMACQYYMRSYARRSDTHASSSSEAIVSVINEFCKVPSIVNIEDDDGRSALEYAIQGALPLKAVRQLQRSSQDSWKQNNSLSKEQGCWSTNENIDSTHVMFTERSMKIKRRAAITA